MASEQPLEPEVVRTWLAMWEQRDPSCDDAVRHLQTLIPDNHCCVVITLGIGRERRSLVFRPLEACNSTRAKHYGAKSGAAGMQLL